VKRSGGECGGECVVWRRKVGAGGGCGGWMSVVSGVGGCGEWCGRCGG